LKKARKNFRSWNALRRASGAAWRRPAVVFEHRSAAALSAVSSGAQKTAFGRPAQQNSYRS
jgi:hypothetical protein